MAMRFVQAFAIMQVLIQARGNPEDTHNTNDDTSFQELVSLEQQNITAQLLESGRSLRGDASSHWKGCNSLDGSCRCVDQKYEEKCKDCMCEWGTMWCDTACDPHVDPSKPASSSCCQPFKKINEVCGQGWECGPSARAKINNDIECSSRCQKVAPHTGIFDMIRDRITNRIPKTCQIVDTYKWHGCPQDL